GGSITIGGKIFGQAVGSISGGGGFGSEGVELDAGASIFINEVIDVSGGAPEGFGGSITLTADVDIIQTKPMFAVGSGTGGTGGDVSYVAGRRLSLEALNDVSGSDLGGDFAGTGRIQLDAK